MPSHSRHGSTPACPSTLSASRGVCQFADRHKKRAARRLALQPTSKRCDRPKRSATTGRFLGGLSARRCQPLTILSAAPDRSNGHPASARATEASLNQRLALQRLQTPRWTRGPEESEQRSSSNPSLRLSNSTIVADAQGVCREPYSRDCSLHEVDVQ